MNFAGIRARLAPQLSNCAGQMKIIFSLVAADSTLIEL